jgi:HAMP domain-containing protein
MRWRDPRIARLIELAAALVLLILGFVMPLWRPRPVRPRANNRSKMSVNGTIIERVSG